MARTFDATTERLSSSDTTTCPAAQGTIAFWLKPAWNSGDSQYHFLWACHLRTSPSVRQFALLHANDNNLYCGWVDFGAGDFDELTVSDSGLFSSGTWAHWAMTWSDSADTIELFRNGSSVGTRTSGLVTYGSGTGFAHYIGNLATDADARGDMAECGMWSSVLGAADIAALGKGASPMLVSPSTLDVYLPLIGNASPETNLLGASFTVTGATKAVHLRIQYP